MIEIIFPSSDKIKRKTIKYSDLLKFIDNKFKNWEDIIFDLLLSRLNEDTNHLVTYFVIEYKKQMDLLRRKFTS